MGELHPKPKLSMFWGYLKIMNTFFKVNMNILKQLVWQIQK